MSNKKRKYLKEGAQVTGDNKKRSFDLQIGCQVSFKIMEVLGKGGFGIVKRAINVSTGEEVAIKTITVKPKTELSSLPEILYLSHYKHKNIVELKNYGRDCKDERMVHIVMEYAHYGMRSIGLMCEMAAREVMRQILHAIAYLHRNGIIHGDIKVDNVLINNLSVVKLCDFGLATHLPSTGTKLPLIHVKNPRRHPFGTLWYCAPELLSENTHEYSTEIDIWSVGCFMGEILCGGKPLFTGVDLEDQLDQIKQLIGLDTEQRQWAKKSRRCTSRKGNKTTLEHLQEKFPSSKLSKEGFDLLKRMLDPNPNNRITAEDALKHSWFSKVIFV